VNSSIVRRAKAVRLFGFVVMLAGFVPVLLLIAQSALGVLPPLPGWPPLDRFVWIPSQLQAWLITAVVGLAVMALGAAVARRQMSVLQAAARHREDSLRRTHQYSVEERIEPYIGPGLPGVTFSGPEPRSR
jgi:hypothetical protein